VNLTSILTDDRVKYNVISSKLVSSLCLVIVSILRTNLYARPVDSQFLPSSRAIEVSLTVPQAVYCSTGTVTLSLCGCCVKCQMGNLSSENLVSFNHLSFFEYQ
jgi:hypothetical protein